MTIDEDFQKTEFQKVMTQWTFSQSTGIVMALVCIAMCVYWNYGLTKRIEVLETQQTENALFLRNFVTTVIEPNTRALNENTRVMQDLNNYLRLKSFSK